MSLRGALIVLRELGGRLGFREFRFFGQIAVVLKWSSIHWEVNAVAV